MIGEVFLPCYEVLLSRHPLKFDLQSTVNETVRHGEIVKIIEHPELSKFIEIETLDRGRRGYILKDFVVPCIFGSNDKSITPDVAACFI